MLVKYCKSEHNLFKGNNTIKLGTTDYYKETYGLLNYQVNGINNLPFQNYYIFITTPEIDLAYGEYNDKYIITDPLAFRELVMLLFKQQFTFYDIEEKYRQKIFKSISISEFSSFIIQMVNQVVKVEVEINNVKKTVVEDRLLIALYHPKFGYIPVRKEPKILTIDVLANCLLGFSQNVKYEDNYVEFRD